MPLPIILNPTTMPHTSQNHSVNQAMPGIKQVQHTSPLKLAHDLGLAILSNQLEITIQPKISLITFQTTGYEVLLRWNHPHIGLIPADRWIKIAQDYDLINKLTFWLVNEVILMQKKALQQEGTPSLPYAINISPTTLTPHFAQQILAILKSHQVPTSLLEVEITEAVEFDDYKSLSTAIEILRQQGIKVGLDDFGAAYATMRTLDELTVDELKIDKSLVQSTNKASKIILKNIVNLAHEMGLSIVFEGIETQEQLNVAKELGVHKGQGYLFSKPHLVTREHPLPPQSQNNNILNGSLNLAS